MPRVLPWIYLSAVLLGVSPSLAAGNITALLADGRTLEKVEAKPGPTPEQVTLVAGEAAPLTLPAQDLLVLDFNKLAGRQEAASVRFTNGDQVIGALSFPSPKQIKVTAGWGVITAPLSACAAIRLDRQAALPGAVTRDTLILKADRVEGELVGITADKVQFQLGGKPISLDRSRVLAIGLASRPRPSEGTGLLLSLDLGGGERLTGRWVRWGQDVLTVRLDWGATLDIPTTSLARLEVKNGKLVYVSDLKPTEARQVSFLDGSIPYRRDLSVSGRPLRLGGKTYRRGLGVHSRSELTFALDGGFQHLQGVLGVDESVGNQGSVVFRVYGDDKPLFESPILRGGDAPLPLKIDLKGVLLLRLEVDYGDGGDIADHANWADLRLLRQ